MGSVRSAPIESLGNAASLNIATEEICNKAACQAYIGIECIPENSTACIPDEQGNIGRNNIGSGNFGFRNDGNNNTGAQGGWVAVGRGGGTFLN